MRHVSYLNHALAHSAIPSLREHFIGKTVTINNGKVAFDDPTVKELEKAARDIRGISTVKFYKPGSWFSVNHDPSGLDVAVEKISGNRWKITGFYFD